MYVLRNFPIFLLLLIFSFISLYLEKILDRSSIFLNLLTLVLWPNIWSIPENALCVLEKNVLCCCWRRCCVCVLGPFGLQCCSKTRKLLFPYWFFCQDVISIVEREVLKSLLLLYCCLFLLSVLFVFVLYLGISMLDRYLQ